MIGERKDSVAKPIQECKCQCSSGSNDCKLSKKLKHKTIEYESDESKENHDDSELVFDTSNQMEQPTQCTCGAQKSFENTQLFSGDEDDLPEHQKPQKYF